MFSDLEKVTDYVLSKNSYSKKNGGAIQMGVSLGGNVVLRYNRVHGADKLCGTIYLGGPYRTLDPLITPNFRNFHNMMPSQLVYTTNAQGKLVSVVEVVGELEREMVHYDLEVNKKVKRILWKTLYSCQLDHSNTTLHTTGIPQHQMFQVQYSTDSRKTPISREDGCDDPIVFLSILFQVRNGGKLVKRMQI